MRNSLMLQFYEVIDAGCQSKRKYEHLGIGLEKLHHELLAMDDDCDVGSAEGPVLNNQVLSNLPCIHLARSFKCSL
jgi:hypothetical protein